MSIPELSKRLRAVADFVRPSAVVADVGTDHAYLPIHLVTSGKAKSAVASDINEGPYLRAKQNVADMGLDNKILTLCTAGLCGIEPFSPTDILICGMGGELIASILGDAPWTRALGIRLVLQPMTHPETLRHFLLEGGYSIVGETLVKEEKIYQIICAEYTGEITKDYTEAELLLGRLNAAEHSPLFLEALGQQIKILEKIKQGKLSGDADTSAEDALIHSLEDLKNDGK